MDFDELAETCKALSDPTRLRIFQFLKTRCCPVAVDPTGAVRPANAATVGEVCCHIDGRPAGKIDSRISFHLKVLKQAGLINTEKRGKFVICSINPSAVARLACFLQDDTATPDAGC